MQVTLDIPDKIAEKAQAEGVAVEVYLRRLVEEDLNPNAEVRTHRFGSPTMTSAEAAESIRQIASRSALAGLKIEDLMHEGHEY